MDPELQLRLAELETKIDAIHTSVEKTRKYFLWTMIGSIALIVLPLLAMAVILPKLLSSLSGLY